VSRPLESSPCLPLSFSSNKDDIPSPTPTLRATLGVDPTRSLSLRCMYPRKVWIGVLLSSLLGKFSPIEGRELEVGGERIESGERKVEGGVYVYWSPSPSPTPRLGLGTATGSGSTRGDLNEEFRFWKGGI